MKNAWLYATGMMLLGIIVLSGSPAGAANVPGAWDQTLEAKKRFEVLTNMNSEAVLDKETGLVWEQSPSMSTFDWYSAQRHCNRLITGGRLGWRLPTIQELASLMDPTQSNPALPPGHPFGNVQSSIYWSATTSASNPDNAWFGYFFNVTVFLIPKSESWNAWCVRGGQGVDPQ
jgi:hypothetical protein